MTPTQKYSFIKYNSILIKNIHNTKILVLQINNNSYKKNIHTTKINSITKYFCKIRFSSVSSFIRRWWNCQRTWLLNICVRIFMQSKSPLLWWCELKMFYMFMCIRVWHHLSFEYTNRESVYPWLHFPLIISLGLFHWSGISQVNQKKIFFKILLRTHKWIWTLDNRIFISLIHSNRRHFPFINHIVINSLSN